MSKISDYQQNFLETLGFDLGYDENNMPKMKDIEVVISYHIPVWEYNGMTKEEYYS
jgi:hypothetical protein